MHLSLLKKVILIFAGVFLVELILGAGILYQVALQQTQVSLQSTAKQIHGDISFANGSWNVSRYNSDPNAEGAGPVYILGSDGYVIDRWKPIHGFLDTSDLKHLLAYKTPQTITTSTQQTWRIYSKPVIQNNQNLGVITVAFFNPTSQNTDEIDSRLLTIADTIKSKLHITQGTIDTSTIDIRDISYDVSFQIVDRYNKIIAKNNNTNSIDRIPNFIDLSYVGDLLTRPTFQHITDSQTGERFLFLTSPLVSNNTVVGVIVTGLSISYIGSLLQNFLLGELLIGIALTVLGVYFMYRVIKPDLRQEANFETARTIEHIAFDKKESSLIFDDTKMLIPFATNQYYLLECLFSNPKKRWETDELLERFGEHDLTNTRKVYDTMLVLNKKTAHILGEKLLIAKEKTYQINPLLLSKIS